MPNNNPRITLLVLSEEARCEIHAIERDTVANVQRAFEEAKQRIARVEDRIKRERVA